MLEIGLALLVLPFWGWMFVDCAQNEYHRTNWSLALILLNVLGAILYFFMRWLPRHSKGFTYRVNRLVYRQQLRRAKAAVKHMGKPIHYVELGRLYAEMGQFQQARSVYEQALTTESKNRQMLWEAAEIENGLQQWTQAKPLLARLIELDPNFRYGDAYIAYGRALFQLGEYDAAAQHLKRHLHNWSRPDAYLMLAEVAIANQDPATARVHIETMIEQVESAPTFHYRKYQPCLRQGRILLKGLPMQAA